VKCSGYCYKAVLMDLRSFRVSPVTVSNVRVGCFNMPMSKVPYVVSNAACG
jgi:hypothetical protein